MKLFYSILLNNACAGFANMLLWFAVTFWVFLETKSVFVTGMLGGIYLVLNLLTSIWFGSLVDHNRKKTIMMISSGVTLCFYMFAGSFFLFGEGWVSEGNILFWIFLLFVLLGGIVGNLRMIAIPPLVTLLIPESDRDRANGKVGMIQGLMFTGVSAFSGFLVGHWGMKVTLMIVIIMKLSALIHLVYLKFPYEPHLAEKDVPKDIDIFGTIRTIRGIDGLFAMIFFAMFNNFLGGVFMALIDAYGLSLTTVEMWGILLAITSMGFVFGGMLVSKFGLGRKPVRLLLLVNMLLWIVTIIFPIVPSILFVVIGFFLYMFLSPVAEAAEQTILQKIVPLERQGRVFGFGQSMENVASPITAFLIGPITQFIMIPWLASPVGIELFGGWWGNSPDRAMAIVFVIAGFIGLIVSFGAFLSRSYRVLSLTYIGGTKKGDI